MYPFCTAKRPPLHCKRTTSQHQKDYISNKKESFLDPVFLHTPGSNQRNQLCISTMDAARPKLKKFALRIFWCAQLAVLSRKNANIVSELNSSYGVEGVRWC